MNMSGTTTRNVILSEGRKPAAKNLFDEKETLRSRFRMTGQSTTEYLLVTLLASVFVFALAVRMSPELQITLNHLEDVVALKISGGKLLGHVTETETVRFGAPVSGFSGGEATATPTEADEKRGETIAGVTPESGSGSQDLAFLEGSQVRAKRAGQPTDGGEERESSAEPLVGPPPQQSPGIKVRPPTTTEEGRETAKKKAEDGTSKSKGKIYQEGEEGEIFGATGFNWLRLLIILLIIILVAYIGFEIFKGIKSSRIGR